MDRSKVMGIQAMAKSFEYIVTSTEIEALVLESNLIKEFMPRYNVRLKDDKAYPYICLTLSEDFPQVQMARTSARDKNKYFGPFTSTMHVEEVVELARSIWPLRNCARKITAAEGSVKERPCLNYHIGKCTAPCGGHISKDEYKAVVAEVYDFLSGKRGAVEKKLEAEMTAFAEKLEYEKAAEIRDKLNSVRKLDQRQSIENISAGDHDVIAMAREKDEALVQVFFVRNGKMTGREHFMMNGVSDATDGTVMQAFITQFYSGTASLPRELDVQCDIADRDVTEEWLRSKAGRKVPVVVPSRGDKLRLMELAQKNAEITLTQFGDRIRRETERTQGAVNEIAALLGLDSSQAIDRIEAYDISNIQGYESVASMVVFEGGKAKRSDYRKFKLKTVAGANDYASMEEVITRRFNRYKQELTDGLAIEDGKFSKLPDLILMDGGKGQASSCEKALAALDLDGIPVCGMVKDDRHKTRGLVYRGTEYNPARTSEGFKLITRIQDEVHRFAIEYHRKLREKAMVRSVLDDIPGVGPERRKALLRFFGSVEGIEAADVDTLLKANKMTKKTAEAVYNFFHKPTETVDSQPE